MTSQVEIITSVQRRRRWSRAEKERIVAAAIEPGANACEVARQAGIHQSQLFRWRRDLCGPRRVGAAFMPVAVATEPEPTLRSPLAVDIAIAIGCSVRIR
jgi:transposase